MQNRLKELRHEKNVTACRVEFALGDKNEKCSL